MDATSKILEKVHSIKATAKTLPIARVASVRMPRNSIDALTVGRIIDTLADTRRMLEPMCDLTVENISTRAVFRGVWVQGTAG